MAREVKIELDDQLNIKVIVDNVVKKEIPKEDRQINALEIYESIDCDYENQYELAPIQEKGSLLEAVYDTLKTFYDLYKDIITEVNEIIIEKTHKTVEENNQIEEII